MNILIIAPSWVGDTMMAQGLFKLLKTESPAHTIDVLAPEWTYPLVKRMPEVNDVMLSPFIHGDFKPKERYFFGVSLRTRNYEKAIVLPNTFKSAIIPWAAAIPTRTGWFGECRMGLLNDTRFLNKKKYPRMIERYLALGLLRGAPLPNPYPVPSLSVTESQQHATSQHFQLKIDQSKRILALCPGAAFGAAKCWPPNYFAELARKKQQEGYDIWLFGAKQDAWALDHIALSLNHQCEHFGGRLTLDQTVDLLSLATCIVSNDSGLMHIGAALNKPLFAIFGPTNPEFTPPLSDHAVILTTHLPCQPCGKRICPLKHHHCMIQLTPDYVLAKMREAGF